MKSYVTFIGIFILAFILSACDLNTYRLSGQVATFSGESLEGVTITLSGDTVTTTVTDSNGEYEFEIPAEDATYTVRPSFNDYIFEPEERSVQVSQATSDVIGINFVSKDNHFYNNFGMEFKYAPAGTFMMGSPEDEPGRRNEEVQYRVTLRKSFYVQTTEVTQAQWLAVMGTTPSYFNGCSDCPVENVSWNDAQDFIAALNSFAGGTYRLPSEIEWEYACRAGSTTALANGDINSDFTILDPNLDKIGWYTYNSDTGEGKRTHPVAQKDPNAWGLYDMHGNVREWCQDTSSSYNWKITRGGSWVQAGQFCRSAWTDDAQTGYSHYHIGFRVVCDSIPNWSVDTDGDGVTNNRDFCPNTLAGVSVDAAGCSEAQIKKDADDDGVTDALDNCPNTPPGETADAYGCSDSQLYTNSLGMSFSLIPAGTFMMGSPDGEPGKSWGTEVLHSETIANDFYMQTTEVTKAQWGSVMERDVGPCSDCPMNNISYGSTQSFINALNKLGEGTYRLPTEAEWEYACRAGSTTAFANGDITVPFGFDPILDLIGWFDVNSAIGIDFEIHPVGLKIPNAWRLYDMHGNVNEWCELDGSTYKILRGGSSFNEARSCRSAASRSCAPSYSDRSFGFRLVRIP